MKNPNEAIEHYKQALKLAPNESYIYGALGHTLRDLGNLNEAIKQHKKALVIAPNEPLLYGALGDTLREMKNPNEAIEYYKQALKLAPNESWPYRSLCETASSLGKADSVIDECERAVELNPDDLCNHDSRGLARALTGNYSGAVEDFEFFLNYAEKNSNEELYAKRKAWVTELRLGRNPFDELTLEAIRNNRWSCPY